MLSKELWYTGNPKDFIRVCESENWVVDYDEKRSMYRISYFEDNHFKDEYWFESYKDKEVDRS